MQNLEPQLDRRRRRSLRDLRRRSAVQGPMRRGTIMIFVLSILVLLALIGLLLIARTHTESKRVSNEAAASSEAAAMDDVLSIVRQTLRDDIWGNPSGIGTQAMALSNNRDPNNPAANNANGLLENNESFDAPGPNDRWLASTVPYYVGNKQPNLPVSPEFENDVLAWSWVSYLGSDLLQGATTDSNPFRWRVDARTGALRATTPYTIQNLANVPILQTPPPGMIGDLIPGSTTNKTIAAARRAWEAQTFIPTDGLPAGMVPRFPYFDTNADGIIDLYDADGDGVPDSPISFVIPVKTGEPNAPKELYAVIRIVDHGSMLNVNVASSLRLPMAGGGSPNLNFDETTPDLQRRGRRMTELLLDETVHPADVFGRASGMVHYRARTATTPSDPVAYDRDVVRSRLVGGHSAAAGYSPYTLADEASLRHRNMLVPPNHVADPTRPATDYSSIDRALRGTLLWSRSINGNKYSTYAANNSGTWPRSNRLNSNYTADPNDPGYAYYEGYDASPTFKGWRSLLCDDDPMAVRRPLFTTASQEVVPSPPEITMDPNEISVQGLPTNPVRFVGGINAALDKYMAWPVLTKALYPNVPAQMRVLPIDINLSDPNDANGEATKEAYIQYMAAAMYFALGGASSYQGIPLSATGAVTQPQAELNRQYLAWQFAANIADYRDSDGAPTILKWVYQPDPSGTGGPNEKSRYIFGVEKQPFFTEAYARLVVDTGPQGQSGPPGAGDDKWFFAVELYVPPLWKVDASHLYLRSNNGVLTPLADFSAPVDGPFPLVMDGGQLPAPPVSGGKYYALSGGDAGADPPGMPIFSFYRDNNFRMATDGDGPVELVYQPDPADPNKICVLDVIRPADTSGMLAPHTDSGLHIWAKRPTDPAWTGTMEWSMLRSTQGWRFTSAWQVYREPLMGTSDPVGFVPSLGAANTAPDGTSATPTMDDSIPESVWPTLVRLTNSTTYGEPFFPKPNGSTFELVRGFTSGQPFEAFDSVGEISRQFMVGPIRRADGQGPPWVVDSAGMLSTDVDLPATAQIAGALQRAVPDLPNGITVSTSKLRCMAGRVDFAPANMSVTTPWSWRLLNYLTTQSPIFDGIDNDGSGSADLSDASEGVKVLNRVAGRINVNTAPPSVLRSIPFMTLLPTSAEYTHHVNPTGPQVLNPVGEFTANPRLFWDFASAIVAQREKRPVSVRLADAGGAMQTVAVAERRAAQPGPGGGSGPSPGDTTTFDSLGRLAALSDVIDTLSGADYLFATDRFWTSRSSMLLPRHENPGDPNDLYSHWSSPDFQYRKDLGTANPTSSLIDYVYLPGMPNDNGGIRGRDIYLTRWASMLTTRSDVFTAYIALMDENGNYIHRCQLTLDRTECFAENPSEALRRPILPKILIRQEGGYMDDTK